MSAPHLGPATTRRGLLLLGAAGAAGALASAGSLTRLTGSAATATGTQATLFVTEGRVRLIDGTSVIARSFSPLPSGVTIPGPPIVAVAGEPVSVTVTNTRQRVHRFAIDGVVPPTAIGPGATQTIHFTAPSPGTYLYEDPTDAPVSRVLGLHGVLISTTPGDPGRFYPGGPRVRQQHTWILNEIDPAWNDRAARGLPIAPDSFVPRYFTINGRSGIDAVEDPATAISGRIGDTTLIRIAHAGLAAHALHWHGNHVTVLTRNGRVLPMQVEKDTLGVFAGDRTDVLLPFEHPRDAVDAVRTAHYPMHDHLALGTTAGGGLYPQGLLTHWSIHP